MGQKHLRASEGKVYVARGLHGRSEVAKYPRVSVSTVYELLRAWQLIGGPSKGNDGDLVGLA